MVRRIDRAQRQQDIAVAAMTVGQRRLQPHAVIIAGYDQEIRRLENDAPPRERLRLLLEWMLPATRQAKLAERSRVLMISQIDSDASVKHFHDAMDKKMRQLLKDHVTPLVPADRVASTVGLLRVAINGIVLSTAEHPNAWPKARQLEVISRVLDALALDDDAPHLRLKTAAA